MASKLCPMVATLCYITHASETGRYFTFTDGIYLARYLGNTGNINTRSLRNGGDILAPKIVMYEHVIQKIGK